MKRSFLHHANLERLFVSRLHSSRRRTEQCQRANRRPTIENHYRLPPLISLDMTAIRNSVNRREKRRAAEIFSPQSFEEYFEAVTAGYRRMLADAVRKKEIDHLDSSSIEVAAVVQDVFRTAPLS
jgi:cytochrome P450